MGPTTGKPRFRTRCCCCQHPFQIGASLAMLSGHNSGHATCPKCKEFLHVELLEGDEAWTERWGDYLARETYGPSVLQQWNDTQGGSDAERNG